MAPNNVAGDVYFEIDGQLLEIKRQIRQRGGYPHNLRALRAVLQRIIEGNLILEHGRGTEGVEPYVPLPIDSPQILKEELRKRGLRFATLEEALQFRDGGGLKRLKSYQHLLVLREDGSSFVGINISQAGRLSHYHISDNGRLDSLTDPVATVRLPARSVG